MVGDVQEATRQVFYPQTIRPCWDKLSWSSCWDKYGKAFYFVIIYHVLFIMGTLSIWQYRTLAKVLKESRGQALSSYENLQS